MRLLGHVPEVWPDQRGLAETFQVWGRDVVGIDEAQFFDDEIVTVCNDLANKGVRVVVAGLDMDFKGNPFGPMPALMATAAFAGDLVINFDDPNPAPKKGFEDAVAAFKKANPDINVTVNINDDFVLEGGETRWRDGPLTRAVREGAICYLDEVVEARQDTTVVIHPLTDHRRQLPLEKKGELVNAHPDFQVVISYNPGYQSMMKDLKQSTKQRFGAMSFDYPTTETEVEIVSHEAGVDLKTAERLVQVAQRSRNLKGHGLDEGMSTRLLVYAGQLIAKDIAPQAACQMALVEPLTDDPDMRDTLQAAVSTFFPEVSGSSKDKVA